MATVDQFPLSPAVGTRSQGRVLTLCQAPFPTSGTFVHTALGAKQNFATQRNVAQHNTLNYLYIRIGCRKIYQERRTPFPPLCAEGKRHNSPPTDGKVSLQGMQSREEGGRNAASREHSLGACLNWRKKCPILRPGRRRPRSGSGV